jgi:hypothetical protein
MVRRACFGTPVRPSLNAARLAALLLGLPIMIAVPATAFAANACVVKNSFGGIGYAPADAGPAGRTGTGGTGYTAGTTGETGPVPRTGTGGTGLLPDDDNGVGPLSRTGTGGTGKTGSGGSGKTGSGGSGAMASGVGVVGTITGFASICINGLEVHYAANTLVTSNGLPASTADLAVGQVVTIDAAGDGKHDDEFSGVRVSVLNAVVGAVSAVDAAAKSLQILGQTVRVTPQTLIADSTGIKTFDFLQVNALVRVSGLRLANGDIVASRVETALSLAQASVVGPVTQRDADGFSIYGLRIANGDVTGASAVAGGEVMVSGRLDGSTLRPERVALSPSLSFAGDIDHLVLEGYIGSASSTQISVGGVKVALSAATGLNGGSAADLQINRRVQIVGRLLADRSMVADSILLRRDPLAPPSAASILPPSKAKSIAFGKAGGVADTTDTNAATKLSASRTGSTGGTTGSTIASTVSTTTTTTTTTVTTTPTTGSGPTGGGSGAGDAGGGLITPGGTTTTPVVTKPQPHLPACPFKFDTLNFKPFGMAHGVKR